jgi:hypothetical protein
MIVSHEHKYVHIAIPRNASKSVSKWLARNYQGECVGFHHQWRKPPEAADYLTFTVVRNPYERAASGSFALTWDGEKASPEKRVPSEKPEPSTEPLEERLRKAKLRGNATLVHQGTNVPENGMNQAHWIKKAGISLVLYFESLPECLGELPFVDRGSMPPLSHALERGIRPPGNFFDHFAEDAEACTWAYAKDDFELLGYRRYDAGPAEGNPSSLHVGS